MSRRTRFLAAAAGVLAIAAGALAWYNLRGLGGAREMVACLPRSAATLLFLDVDGIRRAGILDLIAGSRAAEDADYKRFIAATGFDYRRDLKQVAGAFRAGDSYFLVTGTFDWNRLNSYATSQGGVCANGLCRVRSSQPGRWVSFYKVRRGAMAIAFSGNEYAALDIAQRPAIAGMPDNLPEAPVWLWVPAASMASNNLPAGTRSFTSPLESAEQVLFSIGGANPTSLELRLDVTCPSDAAASDLLVRLEGATNMLRKLIERENLKPNPGDLSGLLTSGSFRREARAVRGVWPLPKVFLETLASGGVK